MRKPRGGLFPPAYPLDNSPFIEGCVFPSMRHTRSVLATLPSRMGPPGIATTAVLRPMTQAEACGYLPRATPAIPHVPQALPWAVATRGLCGSSQWAIPPVRKFDLHGACSRSLLAASRPRLRHTCSVWRLTSRWTAGHRHHRGPASDDAGEACAAPRHARHAGKPPLTVHETADSPGVDIRPLSAVLSLCIYKGLRDTPGTFSLTRGSPAWEVDR